MGPEALVERLWARLFALRALAVVTAAAMLLLCLAGGAWAQAAAALELRQSTVNKEIDGWLHVMVDDGGNLADFVTEALAWRLGVASCALPGDKRPAAGPIPARHV